MVGLTVAVVLLGAPGATAGADQIGATRDQISAVEARIAAGAGQVHALTLKYEQASLQVTSLGQQVQADQVRIAQLQRQATLSETALRQQALQSYTSGSDGSTSAAGTTGDPAVRAEYLAVAAGSITDAVDRCRAQQRLLAAAERTLAQEQRSSAQAVAAAAAARQQALDDASVEQGRLEGLQTQLSQMQAAAAAAAAAAAQPPPAAPQGAPVNNGIVSVVKTVVSPPVAGGGGGGGGGAGGVWLQLRECESSDNYRADTGNGYYGAYQFSQSTWNGLGYPGRPDLEPASMQDQAAQRLQAQGGWGQWPACSAALGLS
jgi:hypothetical protein